MTGPTPAPIARLKLLGAVLLFAGLAFYCYQPALRGRLLWDDDAHVTKRELWPLAGLGRIWSEPHATQQYYPLLHSAFWVEHRLWGDAVLGYHAANLVLHTASALLIVVLLRRLRAPGAWVAGLLFLVHPVCVESVAWISEQKNTLSLFFYLLAALAYLRFDARRGGPGAAAAYGAGLALFLAALATKSVTATLPAALLVAIGWLRGRVAARDVWPLIPWFMAALAGGLVTVFVERWIIGAEGADFDLSVAQRGLLAGRIVWFYLGKLLWPHPLAFFYERWDVPARAVGWSLYLGGLILMTAVLWGLRRRSRGPLACWLFFVGSLFPALGFFNVYPFVFSYVADHFQYVASIGVLALAGGAAAQALGALPRPVRPAGWVLVGAVIVLLASLSRTASARYADPETFYQDILSENPDSWLACNNLGLIYGARGDRERAIALYRQALRLKPDYAEANDNLGAALTDIPGHLDDAIAHCEAALRAKPFDSKAHNNLGIALARKPGRLAEAVAHFQQAVRIKPGFAEAHNNLGNAWLLEPGRLGDAVGEFQTAIALKPDFAEAHFDLGNACQSLPGRAAEAVAHYEEALRLNPGYAQAHYNLAGALLGLGRGDDAVRHFEAACRLVPDSPEFAAAFGYALAAGGRRERAVEAYERALRLKPDFAEVHFNLAVLLLQLPGRRAEARLHLEEGLRLRPGDSRAQALLRRIDQERRGP